MKKRHIGRRVLGFVLALILFLPTWNSGFLAAETGESEPEVSGTDEGIVDDIEDISKAIELGNTEPAEEVYQAESDVSSEPKENNLDDEIEFTSAILMNDNSSGSCGEDLTWSVEIDAHTGCGSLSILGSGPMTDYDLLQSYDFQSGSSAPWYEYHDQITSLNISSEVTSIGSAAFADFRGLKSVTLPEALTKISQYAFVGCHSLEEVTIPRNVSEIGMEAFEETSIKELIIPNGVRTIGALAFANCSQLEDGLTHILVPGSVILCPTSFYGEKGPKTAGPLGEGYDFEFGWTHEISVSAFYGMSSLKTIAFPDEVREISDYACKDCSSLETVYIPVSVVAIKERAFENTSSLKTVYFAGTKTQWDRIAIASGNDNLLSAEVVYNTSRKGSVIGVTGISIDQNTCSLNVGNSVALAATVNPDDATNKRVIWSSSKPEIATVISGVVTGLAPGVTLITANTEDGGKTATCKVTVIQAVTGITVSGSAGVAKGKTVKLTAAVAPENATNKAVTWKSADDTIARVDANGTVTGVSAGETTITATAKDGSGVVSEPFRVTVTAAAERVIIQKSGEDVTKQKITLDPENNEKNKVALSAVMEAKKADGVYSTDGVSQGVTWTSNKPSVAEVDEEGVVTVLTNGTATITAKAADGSNKLATVTIEAVTMMQGMEITGSSVVATRKTIQLKAEVQPANATNKKATWSSSDSSIAKVDASGRVTGVSAGTARITATAQDGSGVSAYRDVTVTTAAEQVLIRQGETGVTGQTLGLDPDVTEKSTLALSAELLAKQPDGIYSKTGVSQEVVWKSSAPKVAEVSQDGIVTACTVGTATITATAADGTNKSARVTINVSRLVSTIAISGESQVAAGKTVTLTASALPDSAKNKTVVWTSSDAAKATVSNGRVMAKKDASGTVTITATAKDGSSTSASYEMTIKKPAEKGIIKQGESDVTGGTIGIDLDDGTPVTLSAVFSAKKADGSYGTDGVSQSVTWKSSAPKVAVVEADGTVTALSAGKSTITATAGDGSGKNARVTVNVARLVSAITISGENEIALGKSVTLTAAAAPDSAANKKVTWTSSNKSVADVAASTGRVTGKGIGTAIITATATDGSGVSSSYEVTVKALTDSVIIKKGDDAVSKTILKQDLSDRNTIALSAVCKGKAEGDAVSQRVTWKSSKPAAATVAPDGTVTLLSPGKVDITATAADGSGKSAKVTLDVTQSAVTITGADKVAAGKSVKLTAQGPKVKWSIVNVTPALSKVTDASVNTSGTLNVKNTVAPGTVITVRATEDAPKKSEEERKTATHVVTVQKNDLKATVCIKQSRENVTGGTIGIDRDTMVPVTLRAEVVDAGGSTEDMSQNVVWKSSAPKVATVDADGTVTPLLAGTTKLTATTTDGTNKSGAVTINVASLAESVTVTAAGNASALAAGKALQFTAAASPKRTAGKKFQWTAVPDYSGIAGFDETALPKNAVSISTAGRLSVNAKVPVGTVIRVRAETLDGSGSISDPYIVTVKKASGRVEIYQKSDTEHTTNLAGRKVGIDRDTLGTVNLKARVYEEAKTGTTVTNISQEVVWTSSNAKVATVVNGVVTAHAAGTATIKATTADGMNKSASVTINVASMVNTISLTGSSTIRRSAKTAASEKYAVSVTPVRSADKKVTWTLSYQLPLGSTAAIKPTDIKVSNGTLTISKEIGRAHV